MKKLSLIMAVLMAIGLFAGCAQQENAEQLPGDEEAPAKEYQYITADEVKTMIENGDEKVIVDIQPEEYYAQGHLPTAISTVILAKRLPAREGVCFPRIRGGDPGRAMGQFDLTKFSPHPRG